MSTGLKGPLAPGGIIVGSTTEGHGCPFPSEAQQGGLGPMSPSQSVIDAHRSGASAAVRSRLPWQCQALQIVCCSPVLSSGFHILSSTSSTTLSESQKGLRIHPSAILSIQSSATSLYSPAFTGRARGSASED